MIKLNDIELNNYKLKQKILFKSSLICPTNNKIQYDCAIVIANGIIVDVGEFDKLKNNHKDVLFVDASDYMIMPGLINSHTHVSMSFIRGVGHEIDEMIKNFNFKKEDKLSKKDILTFSFGSLISSLKSGTTCVYDHFYQIDSIIPAIESLGMRALIGETIIDKSGPKSIIKPFSEIKKQLENWSYSDMIKPCLAPHATDTISEKLFQEIQDFAEVNDFPIHMHVSQTKQEYNHAINQFGMSPVKKLVKHNLLKEKSLIVHLLHFDDQDIELIKSKGSQVVSCPNSQLIYEGLAPIDQFMRKGLDVSIATDCAASNDQMNLLSEAKVFKQLLRHIDSEIQSDISAQNLLEMITSIPARIFPDERVTGTLEKNSVADLVFIKPDIRMAPMSEDYTNLFFSLEADHIRHVMINGEWTLWNREILGLNEDDLYLQFQEHIEKINLL